MTAEIKTNLIKSLPCFMKTEFGQIVLASCNEDKTYVTVLANIDGSDCDLGNTWETKLLPKDYSPLPAGYQITLTN